MLVPSLGQRDMPKLNFSKTSGGGGVEWQIGGNRLLICIPVCKSCSLPLVNFFSLVFFFLISFSLAL